MMPDYRAGNPYQTLLAESLGPDTDVLFPRGYRRVLPLLRALRDDAFGIDVLHLHWLSPYLRGKSAVAYCTYCVKFLIDLALVRISGVAVVWTIHNQLSHEARFPRIELWLRAVVARVANCCIAHSEAAKIDLVQQLALAPDKIHVIPHGHYKSVYGEPTDPRQARATLGLPSDARIFLYFGIVRPYKGIEDLLIAWRSHEGLSQNTHLVIAGLPFDSEYAARLAGIASQCKHVSTHFSWIADERVHLYFSAADAVVLPFQRSLTSGSLLLALSFGKPVIAPNIASIAEALGNEAGLLYDAAKGGSLLRALQSPTCALLEELAVKSLARKKELEWPQLGRLTTEVYLRAIEKQRRLRGRPRGKVAQQACDEPRNSLVS
jgi:glycosyltransferase involved in cell wall biosynthesis